jgi:hypothetical protein
MTDKIIDTERCEGLYVSFTQPNDGQHTPVLIERVNGDCLSRSNAWDRQKRRLVNAITASGQATCICRFSTWNKPVDRADCPVHGQVWCLFRDSVWKGCYDV